MGLLLIISKSNAFVIEKRYQAGWCWHHRLDKLRLASLWMKKRSELKREPVLITVAFEKDVKCQKP